jgi:hypothetical protein
MKPSQVASPEHMRGLIPCICIRNATTHATLRLLPQIQFTRRAKLNRTPTDTSRALTCYLHTPASLNLAFLVIITLYILYYSDTVARMIDSNKRFSLSHAPFGALI